MTEPPRDPSASPEATLTVAPPDTAPSDATLTASPALPPRYRDLGRIAAGGFGEIRRVHDAELDRVVAMKLLRADVAGAALADARFLAEAKLTAGLEHPGIVGVHDRGRLADGRLWFTMREVRGRTLADVIEEVHEAAGPEGFRETASGWTFRRLVDAFARVCQAVAYAHRRGVVHRDLKPANIMVGELGEALVMDWGLGRRVSEAGTPSEQRSSKARLSEPRPSEPRASANAPSPGAGAEPDAFAEDPPEHLASPQLTRHGDVLGTPAYMPPEQALGERDRHGFPSDVYALGAVLYHLLSGQLPYDGGSALTVLRQVVAGPPRPVAEAAKGKPVPAELAAICARAMEREISARYPDAEALAREVVAWLDGARRREHALAVLDEARALEPEATRLRAQAEASSAQARALLSSVQSFDPIEKKRPAWALEAEAREMRRTAALVEARWLERVHGALSIEPELPEAHAMLADHYRASLVEAERARRDEDAARFAEMLRTHDRGRHAAFMRGDGAVTLVTEPAGAEVLLYRYRLEDQRLVPVLDRRLGVTPLVEVPVERGSALLVVRAPGRVEVRYPILIERAGHWDGIAPGERAPHPIHLPAIGDLGPDERYVPAGWCWTGGDPEAVDSLPGRRVWVDALVIDRFPVTNGQYLAFLNALVGAGRRGEALSACPRMRPGTAESAERPWVFEQDASGRFTLPADPLWQPDVPVVQIDWHAASAYAAWRAEATGQPWRLAGELEREKAARGVDGRVFPWGDHPEATYACIVAAQRDEPRREPVSGHPEDESVYGVRGLAGNVRDWCLEVWMHDGPERAGDRLRLSPASPDDPDFRAVRGGYWASPLPGSRSAARFGGRPAVCLSSVGLRVARSHRARFASS